MARTESTQLNVRSRFARERASALARQTGMSTTQVVEAALRAFDPPDTACVGRLVRKGRLLVMPSNGDPPLTVDQVNAATEDARNERLDDLA